MTIFAVIYFLRDFKVVLVIFYVPAGLLIPAANAPATLPLCVLARNNSCLCSHYFWLLKYSAGQRFSYAFPFNF